jgi:hypothetical protein
MTQWIGDVRALKRDSLARFSTLGFFHESIPLG